MRRFTESDKWRDPWFRTLPYGSKLAFGFLCDNVDRAGVWKPDFALADFLLGEKADWKAFESRLDNRLHVLNNGDWLLTKFVAFQYGKLTWKCPPHRTIITTIFQKHIPNGYPMEFACIVDAGPNLLEEPTEEVPVRIKALPVRKTVPKTGRATLEEVLSFCIDAGIDKTDGEWYFHKCEGAGWTVQGRPIIDWKATLRGWRAAKFLPSQKAAQKADDEKARRQAHSGTGASRNAGPNTTNDYGKRPTKAPNGTP